MTGPSKAEIELETRLSKRMLDVLIRAGLVLLLAMMCYRIFSPFLSLMAWALILAVTLYPAHQALAARLKGRQGLAATVLVLVGIVLIVLPTAALMASVGESVHSVITHAQDQKLEIPAPPASVAAWPIIGPKGHAFWMRVHSDLPGVLGSMQPQLGELAKSALLMVASITGTGLLFLASFIIAGLVLTFGKAGSATSQSILDRVVGNYRGKEFARLCIATIRSVALGVVGVASVQALVAGVVMMVAGVPFAGVLAALVLVLAIAQVPVILATLPAVAYIWLSGHYGTAPAIAYTVLLGLAGLIDNVLKPLLLGRGVDAPMPVVLLGALGGLAGAGILGMFVGAVVLSLGHQVLIWWVAANPDNPSVVPGVPPAAE
ncbi:MAG TPA: AI-2E family transporter [Rhizobacter sp.]|nr:AI-2E family transporter [Rhizobacter sp.]